MDEIFVVPSQESVQTFIQEGLQYANPVFTLPNGDKIVEDDHCYVIVSPEGKLRQWIYEEALVALKGLPIPK